MRLRTLPWVLRPGVAAVYGSPCGQSAALANAAMCFKPFTLYECGAAEFVPMRLWQIGVLAYGVLYFILACAMEVENVSQGYPLGYIAFSMVAQTLLVCGVFLFGLES